MQNISPTVRNIFSIPGIRLALFLAIQLTLSLPDIHVYVKVGFCLFALASLIAENPNVKNILPLLTFSATFAAISYVNGAIHSNFELLGMLLCPLTYYLMGCSVVRTSHSDNEILWIILLTIISSNLILWGNIIADVSENGLINVSRIIAAAWPLRSAWTGSGVFRHLAVCHNVLRFAIEISTGDFFISFRTAICSKTTPKSQEINL